MSYRTGTNSAFDKEVFRSSAKVTKKINVSPKQMRGGIRL